MIQRTDHLRNLDRGPVEIDPASASWSVSAGIDFAICEILYFRREALGFDRFNKRRETLDGSGETFCIQTERCFVGINLKRIAHHNIASINTSSDHVPCNAMLRFAIQQRPDWDVQTRVDRQRPIVEIDRSLARQCQHVLRDQRQVRDAEQPVNRDI